MSYYAEGYGVIVVKEGCNVDKITELLEEIFDVVSFSEDTFYVNHYYGNYHEEDLGETLNAIIPFVKEGNIEFSGEEDCYWKFSFNLSTSKWDEINGEIIYGGLASYSDDILLEEVKRRGLVT